MALKVEKPDKARRILVAEYQLLIKLRGLQGIVPVIDFQSQEHLNKQNFIVLELKGSNVASYRKQCGPRFTEVYACAVLL